MSRYSDNEDQITQKITQLTKKPKDLFKRYEDVIKLDKQSEGFALIQELTDVTALAAPPKEGGWTKILSAIGLKKLEEKIEDKRSVKEKMDRVEDRVQNLVCDLKRQCLAIQETQDTYRDILDECVELIPTLKERLVTLGEAKTQLDEDDVNYVSSAMRIDTMIFAATSDVENVLSTRNDCEEKIIMLEKQYASHNNLIISLERNTQQSLRMVSNTISLQSFQDTASIGAEIVKGVHGITNTAARVYADTIKSGALEALESHSYVGLTQDTHNYVRGSIVETHRLVLQKEKQVLLEKQHNIAHLEDLSGKNLLAQIADDSGEHAALPSPKQKSKHTGGMYSGLSKMAFKRKENATDVDSE